LMKMVDQRWRAKTGHGTSQVFNYSRNLPSILEAETRYVVREDRRRGLLDGTAGVPGDSAHDRKAKALARSSQLFEREHARTPDDDELVAFRGLPPFRGHGGCLRCEREFIGVGAFVGVRGQ